jgi:hypothetical protein
MSGTVHTHFDLMVPHGKLRKCISFLEDGMRSLKRSPYHRVIGKDFLPLANDLGKWIIDFHQKATDANLKPSAFYLEMNGFAINPDGWHCNIFGYKTAGDVWDLDWLSASDFRREECFELSGMESVQKAFGELYLDDRLPLGIKLAEEVASHLVTARFMELVAAAHKSAKRRYPSLKGFPVLATAHDWDTVHQTS